MEQDKIEKVMATVRDVGSALPTNLADVKLDYELLGMDRNTHTLIYGGRGYPVHGKTSAWGDWYMDQDSGLVYRFLSVATGWVAVDDRPQFAPRSDALEVQPNGTRGWNDGTPEPPMSDADIAEMHELAAQDTDEDAEAMESEEEGDGWTDRDYAEYIRPPW